MYGASNGSNRAVDVLVGSGLEALGKGVVFIMTDVLSGFGQIIDGCT